MVTHFKKSAQKSALLVAAVLTVTSISTISSVSAAQSGTRAPAQASGAASSGDKMDVSDLEKKYWAAKDTDFNVVQNRLFSKANRLGLTLSYGMFTNDAWSTGASYTGALNYYFSERSGLELNYSKIDSKNNDATAGFLAQGGAPNHTKIKGYYGIGYNWIPFYAKMSVLNGSILYFDMSITPGLTMVDYEQQLQDGNKMQSTVGASLTVSQHFFLAKWLALRLDYKNIWYKEEIVAYKPASRPAGNLSQTTNEGFLMGGFTFYY